MSCRGGGRPPQCVATSGSDAEGVRSDASLFGACDPVAGQSIGFQVEVAFTGVRSCHSRMSTGDQGTRSAGGRPAAARSASSRS